MLKLKKILFGLFVLSSLIAAVWAYVNLKNSKRPETDALSALPDSCMVYLKTTDFSELNKKIRSQSLIADKLKLFTDISALFGQMQLFDSLLNAREVIRHELSETVMHLAIYNTSSDWLAAFNIRQLGSQTAVIKGLSELLNARNQEMNLYAFEFALHKPLFFNIDNGIVTISNSKALIKKSLSRAKRFKDSPAYKDYKATLSEDNLLSVFVNHELYAMNKAGSKLNLSGFCKKGYSAGQMDFEHSSLKVNGFFSPDSAEVLSVLGNQESQSPQEIMLVLPHNMTSFKAYGFNSYPILNSKLAAFDANQGNASFWNDAGELAMYNLQNEFNANMGKHLLGFETNLVGQHFVAAQVNDTAKTAGQLKFMCDSVMNEGGQLIYRLKQNEKPLRLFYPLLQTATSFAGFYNSFLLFAENKDDLSSLLSNLKSGLLALNAETFNYYRSQNFPDSYNYLVYSSPSGNRASIPGFFKFDPEPHKDPFENMRHFSYSLVNDEKAFKFRLHVLNEAESHAQDQNVLWTLNLDTVSTMQPAAFVNHISGENEILVQDQATQLYLVNAKGNVIWKKQIGEKIISEIHKVDIFNNGKFQILFNTKNHIHLIDRNGKYVKGYPVDLPAEATSEICIFDYDNKKEYRIFIACADHAIYNYNEHGIAQEGFIPVKTANEVNLPIQYVKVGKSDYLVALDKEGKIYIFSRKGEKRINLKNRTLANCPAFYVDATNNPATTNLICVDDKSGLMNKISFTDRRELIKLNMDQGSADIRFYLVDDNRDMDLVLTRNETIMAFNFNGDLLYEKSCGTDLVQTNYYSDESHSFYYSINSERNEVVVNDQLKQKTKKIKANLMPLVSNLFNDNKQYFIITNGRQLSCVPMD